MSRNALVDLIPKLSWSASKGQAGIVGIVGGSANYTGAPYFAAITALKLVGQGADLAYVICSTDAAIPIKCYSPDLIVLPWLGNNDINVDDDYMQKLLKRLSVLVIGPGLSRDERLLQAALVMAKLAFKVEIPIIFDGDGLALWEREWITNDNADTSVYLTPNHREFERLCEAKNIDPQDEDATRKLAKSFDNVTIIRKGRLDIISDGKTIVNEEEALGTPRRCGGQGDVLAGALAMTALWKSTRHDIRRVDAGLAACFLVRKAAHLAYAKHGRSFLTDDLIGEIPQLLKDIV